MVNESVRFESGFPISELVRGVITIDAVLEGLGAHAGSRAVLGSGPNKNRHSINWLEGNLIWSEGSASVSGFPHVLIMIDQIRNKVQNPSKRNFPT